MRNSFIASVVLLFALMAADVAAVEMSGNIAGEARMFPVSPLYAGQERNGYSLSAEPEFYFDIDDNKSFTVTPFIRAGSNDDKRNHIDMREFFFLWYGDDWEFRAGIDKVYWGVTEFTHLVDFINQTDSVEGFDGEDKLGQPMVKLSLAKEFGTFDFFILPYFRERTFTGQKGRLRAPFWTDGDLATYENSQKEKHVDFAF